MNKQINRPNNSSEEYINRIKECTKAVSLYRMVKSNHTLFVYSNHNCSKWK